MLETTSDRPPVPTLREAPSVSLTQLKGEIANAVGLDELPPYLEGMAQSMLAELESGETAAAFEYRLASHLRGQADLHPEFHELRQFANDATDRLAEGFPADDRWDPGESQVMAEERLVWQKLRQGFLAAKSPETPDLNAMLDRYEQEFGWWATTGESTPALMEAQRELYVATNGVICEFVQDIRRSVHPAPPLRSVAGVLGNLQPQDVLRIAGDIQRDGFAVFPGALSAEACMAIEAIARTEPTLAQGGGSTLAPFDQAAAGSTAVRFKVQEHDALRNAELLDLAFDPTMVAVSRAYLGSEVVCGPSFLRWSRSTGAPASSAAAQQYHFDLNQLNFLKVLIYIRDVDEKTGPHCFIRGSHHHKPASALRDGRLTDDEIADSYPAEDIREICGPRGTVILADTRGFHKGRVMDHGERLVYFSKYSSSLAGKGPGPVRLPNTDANITNKRETPRLWQHITLDR